MKRIPEMIPGDWHPTPDPTGRKVEFTSSLGTIFKGTVVGVNYREDREARLYVEVTEPNGSRRKCRVKSSRVTWLDIDRPPWVESENPFGRWVMFRDDEGVERFGAVIIAEPSHGVDAVLSILNPTPNTWGFWRVDWRRVKWLPQ